MRSVFGLGSDLRPTSTGLIASRTEESRLASDSEYEDSDDDVEIVSLAGSSLEMIRQTHRRYFTVDQERAQA